jgi:hypothetical protein
MMITVPGATSRIATRNSSSDREVLEITPQLTRHVLVEDDSPHAI